MRVRLTWWTTGIAVAAVLLSIGLPLLGLRVFHASDLLFRHEPWRSVSEANVDRGNPLLIDTVDAVLPGQAEFQRRVETGDFPLWDPYTSGGVPLGAVATTGTLGPLNLPYLVAPIWYAPGLAKLLEMAAAVGFTFLFLRGVGIGRPAAVVGGLIFAFSGFQVVWTNWPQSHVGALIPALFWTVERAVRRSRPSSAVPVALVTGAMVLEGFPPVAGYALVAAGAYAVVRIVAVRGARAKRSAVVVAGMALGIGLAALQVLPFLDRLGDLDLSYRSEVLGRHLAPRTLVTLAVPDAFGSPVDGTYTGPLNYVEIQSFVGVTALVLVAVAAGGSPRLLPRGFTSFLWAGTALVVVPTYLGGPLLDLMQTLPLFGTNRIGRLRSVLGFFLAVLAALGMERLARGERGGSRRRILAVATIASLSLVAAFASVPSLAVAPALPRLAVPLTAAVVAAAALAAVRVRPAGQPILIWIAPALVALEALTFAVPFWPGVGREAFYPATSVHRFLANNLEHERMGSETRTMVPGSTTFYRLRSALGHTFHDEAWRDLLLAVDPGAFRRSPTNPWLRARPEVIGSPVLDTLSVRYFVVAPGKALLGIPVPPLPDDGPPATLAAGRSVTVPVPPGDPRAVVLALQAPAEVPQRFAAIRVEVVDDSGVIVARGWRRVFPGDLGRFVVPLVGSAARASPVTRVRLEASHGEVRLAAGRNGDPLVSLVEGAEEDLRIVHVGGAAIYERTTALPRIRWASASVVETDARERVEVLSRGGPAGRVVLNRAGPRAEGASASLEILEDSGDRVAVRVDAAGGGYLVVADPMQHGWRAELDGRPAELRPADHALVAVFVPAGSHLVVFSYEPEAWTVGLFFSAASVALLAALVAAPWIARRRRAALTGRPPDLAN